MSVLAIAAVATTFAVGTAAAQGKSNVQVPAEFPPSSYTGRQYVDSRGCVYIRAGIDGQVNWVPRMTRGRKVICGFQPSLPSAAARAPSAQTQTAAAEKPVIIEVPQQPVKQKAQPAPKVATKPKKVVRKVTKPATATQPKAVVITAPKPTPAKPAPVKTVRKVKAAPATTSGRQACTGGSALSSQYMRTNGRVEVRCGPQTQPHATVVYKSGTTVVAAPTAVAATTRVAPRHVYENQIASRQGVSVPEGYKPVWEDDRLNPQRAHQTFEGKAQMELAWTKTVPRLLIDRRTGREVMYKYPGLQYPYTSYEQQRAAGVIISTRGEPVQEPVRVVRTKDGTLKRVVTRQTTKTRKVKVVTSEEKARKLTVSTRSAAPKAPAKAAGHRYVQAGVFGDPGNAKRAAQRIANSGLPARMGKYKKNGKTYTIVLAGPFGSQNQLQAALQQVRRSGFGDAFTRK